MKIVLGLLVTLLISMLIFFFYNLIDHYHMREITGNYIAISSILALLTWVYIDANRKQKKNETND